MSHKNNNEDNPGFVRVSDCRERHGKIDLALFGPDGRGGIVNDVSTIRSDIKIVKESLNEKIKGKLSGKDKVYLVVGIGSALIMALASIIVALLK